MIRKLIVFIFAFFTIFLVYKYIKNIIPPKIEYFDLLIDDPIFTQFNDTKKYLKKPRSSSCLQPYQYFRKLLNPKNHAMPYVYFGDEINSTARILNVDKFQKKILDVILNDFTINFDETNFKEIENPTFGIYEIYKYSKVLKERLTDIMTPIKKYMDDTFYGYITTLPEDSVEINCPVPSEDCITYIINTGIIKIAQNESYYLYTLQFTYYINNKAYGYAIICECYLSKSDNTISIKYLKLIGLVPEQDIILEDGYTKQHMQTKVRIYSDYPYTPYEASTNYLRSSDDDKQLKLNDEEIENILQKREELQQEFENPPLCISASGEVLDYDNKIDCEATVDDMGNSKEYGIFEQACEVDTDCPFYQKNTNYTNTRGGCIDGFCELPINVTSLSYRSYEDEPAVYAPYCHNCPTETPDCCDVQEQIVNNTASGSLIAEYNYTDTTFDSPDYAFENDFTDRQDDISELNSKNLEVY